MGLGLKGEYVKEVLRLWLVGEYSRVDNLSNPKVDLVAPPKSTTGIQNNRLFPFYPEPGSYIMLGTVSRTEGESFLNRPTPRVGGMPPSKKGGPGLC